MSNHCEICFQPCQLARKECGHTHHKSCFKQWIYCNKGFEKVCAICRGPKYASEIEWLQFAVTKFTTGDTLTADAALRQEKLSADPYSFIVKNEMRHESRLPTIRKQLKEETLAPLVSHSYLAKLWAARADQNLSDDQRIAKDALIVDNVARNLNPPFGDQEIEQRGTAGPSFFTEVIQCIVEKPFYLTCVVASWLAVGFVITQTVTRQADSYL